MPFIAMDLGGTKLAAALFDDDGEALLRETVPLAGRAGIDVATLMVERHAALRERAGAPCPVGVTVPGIYRAGSGTVWAPNIPGWEDFPLRRMLAEAADGAPVTVDSDRAAHIVGETWRGAARGARDAVFLLVGTGIGAGILVDGRVLRGHGDIAGAIGWLALRQPYRDGYRECGCFEYHASGPGIAKAARALIEADPGYDGELRGFARDELTTAHVFDAAERRDPVAMRVIDDAIALWGMAAANLVSVFNPEVVVFGGGVFGPAARHLQRIQDEATRWAQPIAIHQTCFVASTLGADAPLYGAARLAMQGAAGRREAPIRERLA